MSGGAKNDYWPGFVDALTNVVIAMVFVIVVLAIALSFSAQLLAKRMAAKIAEQERAPPEAPSIESQAPVRQRIAVSGNEAAMKASAALATLRPVEKYLQLDYAPGALTLDGEAAKQFTAALPPLRQRLAEVPGSRIAVVAIGPEMQLSENQRSAFIRAMAVRNLLLEQGVAGDRIAARIDTQQNPAAPAVAVRVEETR